MGPKHSGLVCTSLSALFIDDGDSDDLHSLISLELFLGLPTDWTQLEAEAEKPIDIVHYSEADGRLENGGEQISPLFFRHRTHWALLYIGKGVLWGCWPHTPEHTSPSAS